MKYGCGESELLEISEDSMRCSIALCYYFLACGLKAQKRFMNSPTEDFTQIQREVYDELPQNFETKKGVEIAEGLGMPPRTFKRWLNTSLFKRLAYMDSMRKSTDDILLYPYGTVGTLPLILTSRMPRVPL